MRNATVIEEAILDVASRQHGLITREQLLQIGLSPDSVNRRLRGKRLCRMHRGVYRVGPLMALNAKEMAAVLACGGSTVISHRTAAVLWQLLPHLRRAPIEVSVWVGDPSRRPGIRVHRVRRLRSDEVTKLTGIPITTVVRTLVDLSKGVAQRDLERAMAQAFDRGLSDAKRLHSHLSRCRHHPGVRRLRALLQDSATPALTRSEAEEHFLGMVRRAQLPMPNANCKIGRTEVDFFWREERLVVEIDGFAYHVSRTDFERDRRRDAILAAEGIVVMRVTWRQLTHEAEAVLVRLAQALAARRDGLRAALRTRNAPGTIHSTSSVRQSRICS
jgi:very-short-patch-repair endonuclease